MLMLSRRVNEVLIFSYPSVTGETKTVEVLITKICVNKVKLGIEAPDEVNVVRKEAIELETFDKYKFKFNVNREKRENFSKPKET